MKKFKNIQVKFITLITFCFFFNLIHLGMAPYLNGKKSNLDDKNESIERRIVNIPVLSNHPDVAIAYDDDDDVPELVSTFGNATLQRRLVNIPLVSNHQDVNSDDDVPELEDENGSVQTRSVNNIPIFSSLHYYEINNNEVLDILQDMPLDNNRVSELVDSTVELEFRALRQRYPFYL